MNPLIELNKYGQSFWLDNISRGMLRKGELKKMVDEEGLKGVTSNPTIFQKAIGSGMEYDEQIKSLVEQNPEIGAAQVFEELAIQDIQNAADVLRPVYDSTKGLDGYVSLEVSPELADNTEGTIEEARKLFRRLSRPNVMIKIPATKEGIPAIKQMISEGVNINVTLIFSQEVYEEVAEAYISGLEERAEKGEDISKIASVASFFISRIDSAVDKRLDEKEKTDLKGKIAIANAKLVFQKSLELFNSERFKKLKDKGAKLQRLLWASTSTKNPDYPDTLYIEELIGPDTVNTMPPATITAYKDHGKPEVRIDKDSEGAEAQMKQLKDYGIDFKEITEILTDEGVISFADSFTDLMKTIDVKKNFFLKDNVEFQFCLGDSVTAAVKGRLENWTNNEYTSCVWNKDFKVWREKEEDELSNRLGWLGLAAEMLEKADELKNFAEEARKDFDDVVVLGMGGSSLAPEVFFKTFGKKEDFPRLAVCDSTHPASVKKFLDNYNLKRTLFIVASKSGGTTETMSFFYLFHDALSKLTDKPGNNFIAITDANTSLEKLAKEKGFRKIFTTPDEVGGRYSVLTYFGLVPAALIGVDVKRLLQKANEITDLCSPKNANINNNPGFGLGAIMGELALEGADKVTVFASPKIASFPAWVEQLIAESTGKDGTGILPVVDEVPGSPEAYSKDRIFVFLRLKNDNNSVLDKAIKDFDNAKFPIIIYNLNDEYDLGKEFFRWEIATAMAGAVLKINPFNQPNVQLAKTLATESMEEYSKTGKLPGQEPVFTEGNVTVYGSTEAKTLDTVLADLLAETLPGNYLAVMGFIPYDEETDKAVMELREKVRDKFKIAVTYGYGPRFLHSTGQLHKGDGNNGRFLQITSEISDDIEVPGKGYSFGTLVTAQALGDMKALQNTERKVVRIHVKGNVAEGIRNLVKRI